MTSKFVFFAAYPKSIITDEWCRGCYETTNQVEGIVISNNGIELATMCEKCEYIEGIKDTNPFDELNKKLDRLLSHLGLDPDW